MSNSLLESVEDYIWDQVDEAEYLRRVVEDKHADLDALANKVRFIQSDLHIQLRKGVSIYLQLSNRVVVSLHFNFRLKKTTQNFWNKLERLNPWTECRVDLTRR